MYKNEVMHSMDLLKGSIDLHIHAGPHLPTNQRRVNPVQAALQAKEWGMRAIAYMDVFMNSAGIAWMVRQRVKDFDVFGGILLNTIYAGMNPRAVKTALMYGDGARFVSFGTHSTHFKASTEGRYINGQPVQFKDLDAKFCKQEWERSIRIPLMDPVPEELDEIMHLVAGNPQVYLVTGHVSAGEALRVVALAKRYHISKVLVSSIAVDQFSMDQCKQAIDAGALLERSFVSYVGTGSIPRTNYYVEREFNNELSLGEIKPGRYSGGLPGLAKEIRELGPENFVLDTDYGTHTLSAPVEGMRQFIACMIELRFSDVEIQRMTRINPAFLLGID